MTISLIESDLSDRPPKPIRSLEYFGCRSMTAQALRVTTHGQQVDSLEGFHSNAEVHSQYSTVLVD